MLQQHAAGWALGPREAAEATADALLSIRSYGVDAVAPLAHFTTRRDEIDKFRHYFQIPPH